MGVAAAVRAEMGDGAGCCAAKGPDYGQGKLDLSLGQPCPNNFQRQEVRFSKIGLRFQGRFCPDVTPIFFFLTCSKTAKSDFSFPDQKSELGPEKYDVCNASAYG